MSSSNYNIAQRLIFAHEKGYVNHPDDKGGPTNLGITQQTLSNWRGTPASVEEVKNLTPEEAAQIYRARYWDTVKADQLPGGLDHAVFDFAVNSGPQRAIVKLQNAVGVPADGRLGPQTLSAISRYPVKDLINRYMDDRREFGRGLSNYNTFGRGWEDRWNGTQRQAISLADGIEPSDEEKSPPRKSRGLGRTSSPLDRPDFMGFTRQRRQTALQAPQPPTNDLTYSWPLKAENIAEIPGSREKLPLEEASFWAPKNHSYSPLERRGGR